MDLLFKRYASPFLLLDAAIASGRLCEFIENFLETFQTEREEKTQWEFFLHRVYEKSYAEFKEELEIDKNNRTMSRESMEAIVKHSLEMMNNFNPTERGDEV